MHPADRPVLGEPALAGALVDLPPAIRALRPGDPLEDGRADPAAHNKAGCSACSFLTTSSASPMCPSMLVIELKTCRTVPVRSIT